MDRAAVYITLRVKPPTPISIYWDRALIDWAMDPATVAKRRREGLAGYAKTVTLQPRRPEI